MIMKLDESIELLNKTKNEKQMKNITIEHMRTIMQEMALDETVKDCMYEVLTMEGFLPETLSEGETYEEVMSTMMEDDEIMSEMYKSCSMNESDCATKMEGWVNEKLVGGQKELDKNGDEKIDATDFEIMRKEKGVDEGDHPEGEHYKNKITQICNDLADVYRTTDNNDELPAWIQDKLAVMYHSADAIKTYLHGKNMTEINESEDDEDDTDSPTYLINKKRFLDREISRYSGYVDKIIPIIDKLNPQDLIAYYEPRGEFSLEGFKDFLTKKEEESPLEYYKKLNQTGDFMYRSIFNSMVNPGKRGFFVKYRGKLGVDMLETIEDMLSDIFDIGNSIYFKKKEIERIEDSMGTRTQNDSENDGEFDDEVTTKPKVSSRRELDTLSLDNLTFDDFEDDDDIYMSEDVNYPIKGKNVDTENKSNANKSSAESAKDVEGSQKTTQEKVDNLKNQKYEKNDWEENVDGMLHGWRNNLDLDYKTGVTKDQSDKIKNQALGMAPEDHVNVDHESTAGEKLVDAAKERAKDGFIDDQDYTSKHSRTKIDKNQSYEKTTIFDKLNEEADMEIERLKSLFNYEDKLVNENKKHVVNEDELLFKQVSTKKFI
jgi:hypothetical protein